MINVCILGSTGSIGVQTLNVVRRYPDKFRVVALVCGSNADILLTQAKEFKPSFVGVSDKTQAHKLDGLTDCTVYAGEDAQEVAASLTEVDVVVASVVGLAGLKGVVAAIKAKKKVALANKETLVACGEYITALVKENGVDILPVDSEHCAVFQCLKCAGNNDVSRIILTASGGPFFGKSIDQLHGVTPEQAIAHPNWAMGKKISVDSATMMNKGLEIIEARWLFDCENIDYIIQPSSIIHSMVEYADGSVMAQIARPTMEIPIQYALTYPDHEYCGVGKFPFDKDIKFLPPDEKNFPMPVYAKCALKMGGNMPAKINSANEAGVRLFLNGKIRFTDIMRLVEHTLNNETAEKYGDYLEVIEAHNSVYQKIMRDYPRILES